MMFFTLADLQHRLPVAPQSLDGRSCSNRSLVIHDDIPDGPDFTEIVSIAQVWVGNRAVAFVYRGRNGHVFRDAFTPEWRSSGVIERIRDGITADFVIPCVPHPRRS